MLVIGQCHRNLCLHDQSKVLMGKKKCSYYHILIHILLLPLSVLKHFTELFHNLIFVFPLTSLSATTGEARLPACLVLVLFHVPFLATGSL